MFSGIVQGKGKVIQINQSHNNFIFKIAAPSVVTSDLKIGASVSIDGVCLTVVNRDDHSFTTEVMPESLKRTNLGYLEINDLVNLERSLRLNDEIDGHIVQGHVDFCTKLIKKEANKNSLKLYFSLPNEYQALMVEKGSVAVDGVSLTIVMTTEDFFEVDIIPHTQSETVLSNLNINDVVNIETDILGKYIVKQFPLKGLNKIE